MNKRTILALIVVLALAGSMPGTVLAQSDGAAVDWWVVAGGGGSSSGGDVTLNDTLGQPVAGPASGGSLALGAGYWTGAINGAETATTLVSSPNPSIVGQAVTFTATVTSTAGTPAGLVTFADDGTYLAECTSLALDGNGQAACTTASLAAGTRTITGLYSGNASYDPSAGVLVQQVSCADAIVVANNADDGPGSLRQAIADLCPGGTITFGGDSTVTLASTLALTKPMTIDGESHAVTVSGNDTVRVLHVYTDTHVTLDSLSIARGKTSTPELNGYYPVGGGVKIEAGAVVTLTHSFVLSNTASYLYDDGGWTMYLGYGGGVYNVGTLTVIDTTFSGNVAAHGTEFSDGGGGAIASFGTLQVTDSFFSGNAAPSGAGIVSGNGTLTVHNSTFLDNSAPCGGAGISNDGGTATVSDSTISDNVAPGTWCEGDAAGVGNRYGMMTVTRSIISGNVSEGHYGGLSNYGSSPDQGHLTVLDSSIYDNTANGHGGGIYNWWDATLTVINSEIYSNTATGWGGGILSGPHGGASLTLVNSTLFANEAGDGGGIYNGYYTYYTGATLTVINSTIVGNTARGGEFSTGSGGGLYNGAGTGTLANSILWGNSALIDQEIHNASTLPAIRYSDVEGSGGSGAGWDVALGTDGGGNIDQDPLFVDAVGGDLHLQLTSPAIDAGDNGAVPAGVTTDLDGHPRFADVPSVPDTGLGGPPVVDMGAYEVGPALALHKSVAPSDNVAYHGVVTYTLLLENAGTLSDTLLLTDTLPAGVAFGGWVLEPVGAIRDGETITWAGTLAAGEIVTGVFTATHTGGYDDVIANTAYYSGTGLAGSASAAFTVEQGYSLTVYMAGEGSGVVALDPPGGIYAYATIVTLTATADTGSAFAGWSGDTADTSATVTTTMTADRAITAAFDLLTYTLAVYTDGMGSGVVTLDPPGGVYADGTVVTMTAAADTGSAFAGWSGDTSGMSATVTTTVTADQVITATFDLLTYTLTVYTDGTGSGTVDLDPPGGVYDYGTLVTLTAMANAGSTFAGWSGACSGPGDCRVTITSSQTVTATFGLTQYRVYLPLVSR